MKAKKNKGQTPMDAALSYLDYRPRTVREMERHLDSCQFGEYEVYQAVERLKELGYLDDDKYASDFVSSRLATKPVSRRKLREQLYSHAVAAESIDMAIEAVTDEEELNNAVKTAQKYARQFSGMDEAERKKRVASRLVGRGYSFDTVRVAIERVLGDCESFDIESVEAEDD